MKIHKATTLILILTIVGTLCSIRASGAQAGSNDEIPLEQYLSELGKLYDCYFTLEEARGEAKGEKWLGGQMVQRVPSQKIDIEHLLQELSRSIPNFSFTTDKENPRIIHIADTRLDQKKTTYAMDSVVENIDFAGAAGNLIAMLNKQGVRISVPLARFTDELAFTDISTKMQIKGSGMKVREILSNSVPLEGYRRLIWVSQTDLGGSDDTTYVRFRGPEVKSPK